MKPGTTRSVWEAVACFFVIPKRPHHSWACSEHTGVRRGSTVPTQPIVGTWPINTPKMNAFFIFWCYELSPVDHYVRDHQMEPGETTAPKLLSESDLLTLMGRHEIGV